MKEEVVSPIMGSLRDVCRDSRTALISFIHTRKHTSDKASNMDLLSGSGQIANLLDKGVTMRKSRQPDKFMFSMQKGRNTPEGDTGFFYSLDPDLKRIIKGETFLKSEEGKFLPKLYVDGRNEKDGRSLAVKWLTDQGMSISDIAKMSGLSTATISRCRAKFSE
jgi:hypothetical protein